MEKTKLIKEIIELQREVDRSRRQPTLDVWMSLPITIAQLKSLFFISNQGSSNLGKLAAALGVTPANVTGIVDRLLEQGLVSRKENIQDRRMLLLRTTDKGEELVANLREKRRGYMSVILGHLSVEELTTLSQGLTSLVKAIETQKGQTKDEHD
jgi:MarR family transcriptional regulator, organic hydroperoxide resistance regulator